MVNNFALTYRVLLELRALTLVTHSCLMITLMEHIARGSQSGWALFTVHTALVDGVYTQQKNGVNVLL